MYAMRVIQFSLSLLLSLDPSTPGVVWQCAPTSLTFTGKACSQEFKLKCIYHALTKLHNVISTQ